MNRMSSIIRTFIAVAMVAAIFCLGYLIGRDMQGEINQHDTEQAWVFGYDAGRKDCEQHHNGK